MTARKHVFGDVEALRRKEAAEAWRAEEHRALLEYVGAPVHLDDDYRWRVIRRELGTFRVHDMLVVGDPGALGPEHDGPRAEVVRFGAPDVKLRSFLSAKPGAWRAFVLERLPRDVEGTVTDLFVVHEGSPAGPRNRTRIELQFWLAVDSAHLAILDTRYRARSLLDDPAFEPGRFRTVRGGCITPTYYGDGAYPVLVEVESGRDGTGDLAVGVHVRFLPLEPLDPPEDEDDDG